MVATTATQGLRYPQTSDAPCDGDLHVGWFADDVEEKLNSHDVDLARTLTPPMLIATQSEPVLYQVPTTGIQIAFDVIEQQSGGSFGLFDSNPTEFHFPQLGYYQVGLFARWPQDAGHTAGVSFIDFFLYEKAQADTSFGAPGSETDVKAGVEARGLTTGDSTTLSGLIAATDTATYYSWIIFPGDFPVEWTLSYARMYAVWVGDL